MSYTSKYYPNFVGAVVQDSAEGVLAYAHVWAQAEVIDADDDAAQYEGQYQQRWDEQSEQQDGEGIVARQMAGEMIGVGEVAAYGGSQNCKRPDRNMLFAHFLPTSKRAEDDEDNSGKR